MFLLTVACLLFNSACVLFNSSSTSGNGVVFLETTPETRREMFLLTVACVLFNSGMVTSLHDSSLINPNHTFLDHYTPQSVLFYCAEGATFIERAYVCDGKIDCPDGRDEMYGICNGTNHCDKAEFKCVNDGTGSEVRCVRLDFTCDGEYDCYDGSDEIDCMNPDCEGFECANGYCAATNSECDGFPDCQDHSDENKTMCALRDCRREEFRCDSGQCVSLRGLCDGVPACADGSDESSVLCRQGSRRLHCPDQRRFMCAPGTCLQMNWLCDATGHFHCQQSELKLLNYTDRHSTTTTTSTTSTTPHPEVVADLRADLTDYELNKYDYRDFSFSSSEDDV